MKRTKSGIEVEDCRAGEPFGEFTDGPFRGYASHSETPLFARASPRRPAHRGVLVQDADKVGYALVGTRHVDARPHGNRAPGTLGPQPSGRPWPAVHLEPDGADGGPTA